MFPIVCIFFPIGKSLALLLKGPDSAMIGSYNHNLTGSSGDVVAKLAQSLKQLPEAKLAIVDQSDSTGDFTYNVDLSARRARSEIEMLVSDRRMLTTEAASGT